MFCGIEDLRSETPKKFIVDLVSKMSAFNTDIQVCNSSVYFIQYSCELVCRKPTYTGYSEPVSGTRWDTTATELFA